MPSESLLGGLGRGGFGLLSSRDLRRIRFWEFQNWELELVWLFLKFFLSERRAVGGINDECCV